MTTASPKPWTLDAILRALSEGHGVTAAPSGAVRLDVIPGISTDTRSLRPGELFVALRGARFDGHTHLAEVQARGGSGAIVDHLVPELDLPQIVVPDTLLALGDLASFRRLELGVPVVGITGSSGKTTTKELLRGALSGTVRVHATEGNLNNRIGVPLTLLATPADAEVVILEMGTSEPGEIETLRRMARPDHVLLITVGEAHIEGLGGIEGVYTEKLALLAELPEKGVAVVGDAPAPLPARAQATLGQGVEGLRVAGLTDLADARFRGRQVGTTAVGGWVLETPEGTVALQVPGAHGASNALLALAMADALGVSFDVARAGLEGVTPVGMRGTVRMVPGGVLLLDCYNANPQSTLAALRWLAEFPTSGRTFALLGSMLELGPESSALHGRVLEQALPLSLHRIFATGAYEPVSAGLSGTVVRGFSEPEAAVAALSEELIQGDVILLKGSRGIALERFVPSLERALRDAPLPSPEAQR